MGIVKNIRHAYWENEDNPACKKCHVFLRRVYLRDVYYVDEFGNRHDRSDTWNLIKKRQFVAIGWICPQCYKVTIDKTEQEQKPEQESISCRKCKSTNVVFRKERGESKQYQCRECKAYFSINTKRDIG